MNNEKRTLIQWLFNPFQFIAGFSALALGMLAILGMVWLGVATGTHYGGVLGIQASEAGQSYPVWLFFAEGLINWMAMCVILSIFGRIFSKQKFRLIDVLGTQALARWPYLIAGLTTLPSGFHRYAQHLQSKFVPDGVEIIVQSGDLTWFIVASVVKIVMLIWMIILMYKAYAVSCNLKGGLAIRSFIAGLILAEVASKVLLGLLSARFIGV